MAGNRQLWNDYRETWDAFSRQLGELQALVDSGEKERAECALVMVEAARIAHKEARDRLAAELTGRTPFIVEPPVAANDQVRSTARLFWEFAGRPQGTADRDWFRAERLVRSAAAGCR